MNARSVVTERAFQKDRFHDLHIIDMHCHLGPVYNYYSPGGHIEDMIADADRVGVEKLCIAPHIALSMDCKIGNLQTLDAIRKYPGRVYGMVTVNPNAPEELTAELDAYYPIPQFICAKVHPSSHSHPLSGAGYAPLFEQIAARGGFILTHTWQSDPNCNAAQCELVLKRYPTVKLILAHALGLMPGVYAAIDLANRYENAYLDSSGFEFSNVPIEYIVAKMDPDKIFFGSDMPYHDLRGGIGRILFADLRDEIKEKLLAKNYAAFLAQNGKRG